MAHENYFKAVTLLNERFSKFSSPNSWADNIIAASKYLESREDWGLFYMYLANPKGFDYDAALEQVRMVDDVDEENKFELDDRLCQVVTRNGNSDECVIHVKLRSQDDEKSAV